MSNETQCAVNFCFCFHDGRRVSKISTRHLFCAFFKVPSRQLFRFDSRKVPTRENEAHILYVRVRVMCRVEFFFSSYFDESVGSLYYTYHQQITRVLPARRRAESVRSSYVTDAGIILYRHPILGYLPYVKRESVYL